MSTWRFTIDIEVDDELLEDHLSGPGEGKQPPYGGPETWDVSDLARCFDEEIARASDSEITGTPQKVGS